VKPFSNITDNGFENAIRTGSSLPDDAVNLGWFSSEEITPKNYLNVVDLSGLTPENAANNMATEDDFMMYADEFGVLRYAKSNAQLHQVKHSPIVKNSEVSISNFLMDNTDSITDKNYTSRIDEFESSLFAHSYYVSRFFTIIPATASIYSGIQNSIKINDPDKYNIRVVDGSGNKYSDEYGNNKYQVYIEKYEYPGRTLQSEFCRIIVTLDASDPIGLYLVYDKYEKTSDNLPYNQFLNYKEYINAIPTYSYAVEETEVIDPSSFNRRVYSTQLFAHKENRLLKSKTEDEGWKVVTPKKAIQDPRTFQNFNWRLLAKINYDFSKVIDKYEDTERAVLNVAVLYSGSITNAKNAYVFANLEEAAFNQQNFLFNNPFAPTGSNKTQKNYWCVDIDNYVSNYASLSNGFDLDFVVWTPNQAITANQKRTIDMMMDHGISVFVDCSNLDQTNLNTSGLSSFNFNLNSTLKTTGLLQLADDYVNGESVFNSLDMADYTESTSIKHFGVFGTRIDVFNSNAVRPVRAFSSSPEASDGTAKSIAWILDGGVKYTTVIKDKYNLNSEFSPFAVFSLNPILAFVNDNYGSSGTGVSVPNNDLLNNFPLGKVGSQIQLGYSQASLGANYLFMNIISECNKNKVNSKLKFSQDSAVVWNISPWRNSWTINGKKDSNGKINVLFDDEKQLFKFSEKTIEKTDNVTVQSTDTNFCREINSSLGKLLLDDFEATSMQVDSETLIASDFSNVEFYIECSNDNVGFLNFSTIDNTNYIFADVKTSYSIHKLNTAAKNKLSSSQLTIDAYSKVYSKEFDIKSIYYPYIILDYSQDQSYEAKSNSIINTPKEYLPGSQFVRDYDYAFKTQVFVTQLKANKYTYDVNWSTSFTTDLDAVIKNAKVITQKATEATPDGTHSDIYREVDENEKAVTGSTYVYNGKLFPTNIYSATDLLSKKPKDTSKPINNFVYTNDIPTSGRSDEYMIYGSGSGTVSGQSGSNTVTTTTTVTGVLGGTVANRGYDESVIPPVSESAAIKSSFTGTAWGTEEGLFANGRGSHIYWFVSRYGSTYAINSDFSSFQDKYYYTSQNLMPSRTYSIADVLKKMFDTWELYEPRLNTAAAPIITTQTITVNTPAANAGSGLVTNKYVLYIQYTLNKEANLAVKLTGVYDAATSAAVKTYQSQKNLDWVDAITDSQTKSVMAMYWLDLKKHNPTKFNQYYAAAPQDAKVYIDNALVYSDIGQVPSGKEYRRISFTGTAGPQRIQDFIIMKVKQVQNTSGTAQKWQKLEKLYIAAGSWPVTVKNVYFYDQNLTATKHEAPLPGSSIRAKSSITPGLTIAAGAGEWIDCGNLQGIKYVMVEVWGNKLNDPVLGPYAEGFSLRDVAFKITTPEKGKDALPELSAEGNSIASATAHGRIYGKTTLQSGDFGLFKLGSIADAIGYPGSTITAIYLDSIDVYGELKDSAGNQIIDADGNPAILSDTQGIDKLIYSPSQAFDNSNYSWTYNTATVVVESLSTSSYIGGVSPAITSIARSGITTPTQLTSGEISAQFSIVSTRAPWYQITTTNGVELESIETSVEKEVSNFYVADADIKGLNSRQNKKLSINAKDGAVVLTNSLGQPEGFPNYNSFLGQANVETSFGSTILKWNLKDANGVSVPPPDGLQWGFYNISTREFLGKKLSYQYYTTHMRDLYIGLIAYDADRNAATSTNIIGIDNRFGALSEFQFPAKSICPVYSVKISDRAKISISNPPKDLSKFDEWFINVSRGRFYKKITPPLNYNFTNWLKNYKGVELRCFFDTTKIQIPSSDIFGSGYYDVFEENPIVLSETDIQLRHGSVYCTQQQLNKLGMINYLTDASPIEPWLKVSIKNQNLEWVEIGLNQIRNYNKHTGTISFSKEIVPSDPSDIRVTYVVKNPNIKIYHIDGVELPLNPFTAHSGYTYLFDQNTITLQEVLKDNGNFIKPVHFYLLPTEVEQLVNGEYVPVADYSLATTPIQFTVDYSIFNPRSVNYNPFAIHIGTSVVNNSFDLENMSFLDLRVKGGGISAGTPMQNLVDEKPNILSFADVISGKGYLYPNGGYVIIKIPKEVNDNFTSKEYIYNIVRSNLTAGVAFEIQDMDGNDWRTI